LANFLGIYRQIADEWTFYDASRDLELIAQKTDIDGETIVAPRRCNQVVETPDGTGC